MHIIQAIVLGLVQGLTEFIPVSSSGHLLFLERLMGWDTSKLTFDVALHWGTLVALLCYFGRDWLSILQSFWRRLFRGESYEKQSGDLASGRLLIPIIVATIPAAVIGKLFDDRIEGMRGEHWMLPAVAGALAFFAVVMLLAERVGRRKREIGSMNYVDYVTMGIAQALALFPGVSRSGITISAGLFRNLDRKAAARFSFLLSTPAILGAGLMKLKDVHEKGFPQGEIMTFVVGFVVAAISGYFAVRFLMNYLQRGSLAIFAVYRFALAAAIIVVFLRF